MASDAVFPMGFYCLVIQKYPAMQTEASHHTTLALPHKTPTVSFHL
jgi:hypothetical protein